MPYARAAWAPPPADEALTRPVLLIGADVTSTPRPAPWQQRLARTLLPTRGARHNAADALSDLREARRDGLRAEAAVAALPPRTDGRPGRTS